MEIKTQFGMLPLFFLLSPCLPDGCTDEPTRTSSDSAQHPSPVFQESPGMVLFLRPPFLRTTPRSSSGRSTRQLALVAVALVALLGFTSLLVQTQQDSWTSPSTAPSSSSPSHSWLSDMGIGEGWGGVGWLGDKLGLTSGGGAAAAAAEAERDRPGRDVLQGSKRWDEEGRELWNMPGPSPDLPFFLSFVVVDVVPFRWDVRNPLTALRLSLPHGGTERLKDDEHYLVTGHIAGPPLS